ncbi:MAG TPA: hypothetical protein VK112_02140 [Fodinibius sp.]|nr:hypothetical protein [Fodinibius sp.]
MNRRIGSFYGMRFLKLKNNETVPLMRDESEQYQDSYREIGEEIYGISDKKGRSTPNGF